MRSLLWWEAFVPLLTVPHVSLALLWTGSQPQGTLSRLPHTSIHTSSGDWILVCEYLSYFPGSANLV